jgi:hypothetical protein
MVSSRAPDQDRPARRRRGQSVLVSLITVGTCGIVNSATIALGVLHRLIIRLAAVGCALVDERNACRQLVSSQPRPSRIVPIQGAS